MNLEVTSTLNQQYPRNQALVSITAERNYQSTPKCSNTQLILPRLRTWNKPLKSSLVNLAPKRELNEWSFNSQIQMEIYQRRFQHLILKGLKVESRILYLKLNIDLNGKGKFRVCLKWELTLLSKVQISEREHILGRLKWIMMESYSHLTKIRC